MLPPKVKIAVEYPKIRIVAQHILGSTFENQKYSEVCESVFRQFDAICSYHSVKSMNEVSLLLFLFYIKNHCFNKGDDDISLDEISKLNEYKPKYWITNWSFDKNLVKGFIYKITDGLKGMLFPSGLKLLKTPNEE